MAQQKTSGPSNQTTSKSAKAKPAAPAKASASPQGSLGLQQAIQNPGAASPDALLRLQAASGNRAVQRLTNRSKPAIQAKLTVGAAGDKYEQEADRVATQVMRSPLPAGPGLLQRHHEEDDGVQRKPIAAGISSYVQRYSLQRHSLALKGSEKEDEGIQRKAISGSYGPVIQRHAKPLVKPETEEDKELAKEEEEEGGGVQRKASQSSASGFDAGADVEQKLAGTRGTGRGLDAPLRGDMEQRFGANFGNVRVHTDSTAVQLNRSLSAHAFTHGSDIYFNQGQYNPATGGGKHLLAHELTHVVQQTGAHTLAPKRIQRLTPTKTNGAPVIQRAKKSVGKSVGDWLKRIFIGVPAGLVMAAAGAIVGPIMGGIQGYSSAKENGKGTGGRIAGVLGGIAGGFVGGIGAGLMAGQKLAVHDAGDGDIAWGDAAPDLGGMDSEMLKKRIAAIKEKMKSDTNAQTDIQLITTILQLVDDDGFMGEVLQNAKDNEEGVQKVLEKGAPAPDASHVGDIKVAVKQQFTGLNDPDQYNTAMGHTIRAVMKLAQAPTKNLILNSFFLMARERTKAIVGANITPASTGLFPEEQKYVQPNGSVNQEAFDRDRDSMELNDAYVPDDQKAGFAGALRQMPTVQQILNPQSEGANARQGTSNWKDGGALDDETNIEKVNDLVGPKKWMAPKRLASRTFRAKMKRADRVTRIIVEPQLLARVKKPKVRLHATAAASIDAPWGFRAFGNSDAVDLAYNEATETMTHEVGHAIEGHLPVSSWHNIHMLLNKRHEAAGGGGLKAGDTPIFTTWSEGRFGGKYVTGKYTSRTYSFGNIAEIVSMAAQYFSDPGMAAELIDGDPQHAGIVLRALQPTEYMSTAALRAFDKYLPNKKKPKKVRQRKRAETI